MRHLLSSKFIKRVTQHCNRCLKNVYINNQASKMCSMKATTSDNDKDIHPGGDWPRRVVSGLQPTGALHIGNYFGAIRRCVRLQDRGEDLMIFIADLHSLTTHQDPLALRENVLELTALLLASGVDPERSTLFAQSAVPRHAELCWLLACLATHARLAQLPQYKDKAARVKEVPLGLLLYPVLQVAASFLCRAAASRGGVLMTRVCRRRTCWCTAARTCRWARTSCSTCRSRRSWCARSTTASAASSPCRARCCPVTPLLFAWLCSSADRSRRK